MKLNEIASLILQRQNSSPVIMSGTLRAEIGHDNFALALEKRWVVPNEESGELSVSSDQATLNEMRKLAAEVAKPDPVSEQQAPYMTRIFSNNVKRISVVQRDGGLFEDNPQDQNKTKIGDQVVVAEEGKAYSAVVQSQNPDGSYTLSFGSAKPRTPRNYKSEELRKTANAPAAPGPGQAAPAVVPATQP
jgi:hypothetical protein